MAFCKLVVKASGGYGAGASWFQHWLQSNTGDIDDCADLAAGVADRIETILAPGLSDAWSLGRIDWTFYPDLGDPAFPTQVYPVATILGGNTGTVPLPSRMTMLIEYKALHQTYRRKRCYVGRFNEGQSDSPGVPSATTLGPIEAYAGATDGQLSVNGHDWYFSVVAVDRFGVDPDDQWYAPSGWAHISSFLVQAKWAYMSSRDVNRGI